MKTFGAVLNEARTKTVEMTGDMWQEFIQTIKDVPQLYKTVCGKLALLDVSNAQCVEAIKNSGTSDNELSKLIKKYDSLSKQDVLSLKDAFKELGTYYNCLPVFFSEPVITAVLNNKLAFENLLVDNKTQKGKNQIAKTYMGIVHKIVNQYVGSSKLSRTDLISVALEGLADAIDEWSLEPNKEGKIVGIKTYIGYRVRFKILGEMDKNGHSLSGTNYQALKKSGYTAFDAFSIDGMPKNSDGEIDQDRLALLGTTDKSGDEAKSWKTFYNLLDKQFSVRDCNIFYRFFGLNGFDREKSKDIAKSYGMSEGNIRNSIINKMLKWIKNNPKAKDILSDIQDIYTESLMVKMFGWKSESITENLINDDTFILLESLNPWKNKQVSIKTLSSAFSCLDEQGKKSINDILDGDFEVLDSNFKKNYNIIVLFLSNIFPTEAVVNKPDLWMMDKMVEIQQVKKKYNINMKSLTESLYSSLYTEAEETITDEKSFREYAEKKFEEVFGDKLDKKRMKFTIDGLVDKQQKEDLDWGKVVGMLNKSFGS